MMTIQETPVRPVLQIPKRTFFFQPSHRNYFRDPTTPLVVATYETIFWRAIYIGIVIILIAATLYTMFPHVLLFILIITSLVLGSQLNFLVAEANRRINVRVSQGMGEFIIGTLEKCERKGSLTVGGSVNHPFTSTYTFPTRGGIYLTRTSTQNLPNLVGNPLPQPKTRVVVLYFNDNEHYLL
jgi:hypothetical protein